MNRIRIKCVSVMNMFGSSMNRKRGNGKLNYNGLAAILMMTMSIISGLSITIFALVSEGDNQLIQQGGIYIIITAIAATVGLCRSLAEEKNDNEKDAGLHKNQDVLDAIAQQNQFISGLSQKVEYHSNLLQQVK
ncbi:MAG: hypothetical protein F6K41_43455, partial [Symploca sp. SIO3E6]|nr:hypothetical protein [Caldora sp. SIO3E6]